MAAMTNGQKLLLALTQRTLRIDVAARCGVHKSRVSEWISGITTPSPRARAALQREYGIPDDDAVWGEPQRHRRSRGR